MTLLINCDPLGLAPTTIESITFDLTNRGKPGWLRAGHSRDVQGLQRALAVLGAAGARLDNPAAKVWAERAVCARRFGDQNRGWPANQRLPHVHARTAPWSAVSLESQGRSRGLRRRRGPESALGKAAAGAARAENMLTEGAAVAQTLERNAASAACKERIKH